MKKTNAWNIRILVAMMAMLCCFAFGGGKAQASTKSNMDNLIRYFNKGQYKKVKKYNKKLPKYANEACVKKMSKKMKAAYRKALKKDYKAYKSKYYSLNDVDNDKKAELIVHHYKGNHDAWVVYDYQGSKLVKLGAFDAHWSYLCSYPGHNGVLLVWGHAGTEIQQVTFANGTAQLNNLAGFVSYEKLDLQMDGIRNALRFYKSQSGKAVEGPLK